MVSRNWGLFVTHPYERKEQLGLKWCDLKKKNSWFLNRVGCLVWISLFSFLLYSCASPPPPKEAAPPGVPLKETELSGQVKAMNDRLMVSFSRKVSLQDYRIGPDDLIEISVFEDEKLSRTVRVSTQGNISLPLLGVLTVKGLTAGQLEKEVRDLLAEKYMKDPHVSVFIKEFRNQRISLMGAVSKPGVYDFTGPGTLLDLLAQAGGLREDAGRLLFLIRPNSDDPGGGKQRAAQTSKSFVVGLEELLLKGDPDMNLSLQHGDVVNIPPAGKVFVGGEVRSPGGFALTRRMTLSQAITLAAGLTPKAEGSETKIFRYSGKGDEKEVLTMNVYAIQKGEIEDPPVRENDIIFVPKSGAKTVFYEFWDILKGRVMGWPIVY